MNLKKKKKKEKIQTCNSNVQEYFSDDMMAMLPQEDLRDKRETAIKRLEMLSLVFYVSLVLIAMFLFFYHDWYCAVGHNPCNNEDLKCPWMKTRPNDPSCLP